MLNRPHWQLAILSGIMVGLSYPPLNFGFLIYIAFVPLFYVLLNSTPKLAMKNALIASITANFISLYWIGMNSGAGFLPVFASLIGAVLYLSIFWMALGRFVAFMQNKFFNGLLVLPFAWVVMELLRSYGSLGFPWINLAITQTKYLPLVQSADILGSYGISFWIILLNIGFYFVLTSAIKIKYLALTVLIFIVVAIFGIIKMSTYEISTDKTFTVAVTQPNINPDEKWDPESRELNFNLMHGLLDTALAMQPDMVLWPESAVPAYLRLSAFRRKPITDKLEKAQVPLLSGTVDRTIDEEKNKYYYNSSILLNDDGSYKMYHKIHLVPFAEYIPLSYKYDSLLKLNFGQANFTHGNEYTVFEVDSVKFSNVICYESSIPQLLRKFVLNGAQFITIEANDGWLGNSSGPYQHFELAKLRAIENRIPIVRCANTGISGVIDQLGRVEDKVSLDQKKIFLARVHPSTQITFYTKYGNVFAVLCGIILFTIILISWKKESGK